MSSGASSAVLVVGLIFVVILSAGVSSALAKDRQARHEAGLAKQRERQALRDNKARIRAEKTKALDEARAAKIAKKAAGPEAVHGRWRIQYRTLDDAGQYQLSVRYVRILEVKPRLQHLVCWCELRGAERTFSILAIREAVDASTGEVLDVYAWLEEYKKSRRTRPAAS